MGFSCQGNEGLTEAEKEKIIKEMHGVEKQIVENCEKVDLSEALIPYSNSPDFLSVNNEGIIQNYEELKSANMEFFKLLDSQKYNKMREEYRFINNDNVIACWAYQAEFVFKSGEKMRIDNFSVTLVLKKINNEWKIIHSHESMTPPREG